MTTVAAGSQNPVLESAREPSAAGGFFADTFGFLGTWLRLVWRHWPVLLSFAFAGTIVRELLIDATTRASAWREGLGAVFVFPLVPAALLIAMVLMLRVVRPSLPYLGRRARPESILVYLASVLLPFLAFYFTAGYANYDKDRYRYNVAIGPFGYEASRLLTGGAIVVGVAIAAFLVRWVFTKFEVARRKPWLIFPALYLEVLWLYAVFVSLAGYQPEGEKWLNGTRVWRGLMAWWHTQLDPANPLNGVLDVARTTVNIFTDGSGKVLLAPVSALVAGSVLLAARTSPRRRRTDDEASTARQVLRVGVEAARPIGGRFALIADGVRRVFQAGVPTTMVFCLVFVGLIPLGGLLMEPERLLIGARDVPTIWKWINFPLGFVNDAVVLVLTVCLIAAFVDRTAARIARRSGVTSAPAEPRPLAAMGPVTSTSITVPEQATVRLGPPPGAGQRPGAPLAGPSAGIVGGTLAGPPSYGGLSPITPTYTTQGQSPPTFGSSFGPPAGLAPPPPTGPSAIPPAGLAGGSWDGGSWDGGSLDDGKKDVPGQQVVPGDPDAGWTNFGR